MFCHSLHVCWHLIRRFHPTSDIYSIPTVYFTDFWLVVSIVFKHIIWHVLQHMFSDLFNWHTVFALRTVWPNEACCLKFSLLSDTYSDILTCQSKVTLTPNYSAIFILICTSSIRTHVVGTTPSIWDRWFGSYQWWTFVIASYYWSLKSWLVVFRFDLSVFRYQPPFAWLAMIRLCSRVRHIIITHTLLIFVSHFLWICFLARFWLWPPLTPLNDP